MSGADVSPFDGMLAMIRSAMTEALTQAKLAQPAPYPVAVSVDGAAELLSVSTGTIWKLVRSGRLRTMDLEGSKRVLIPTVALFELDPGYKPADLRAIHSVNTDTDLDCEEEAADSHAA